jgi:hypothetical protein
MAPWWALAPACQTVIGDVCSSSLRTLKINSWCPFGMHTHAVSSFVMITRTVLHLSVPNSLGQHCQGMHCRH